MRSPVSTSTRKQSVRRRVAASSAAARSPAGSSDAASGTAFERTRRCPLVARQIERERVRRGREPERRAVPEADRVEEPRGKLRLARVERLRRMRDREERCIALASDLEGFGRMYIVQIGLAAIAQARERARQLGGHLRGSVREVAPREHADADAAHFALDHERSIAQGQMGGGKSAVAIGCVRSLSAATRRPASLTA